MLLAGGGGGGLGGYGGSGPATHTLNIGSGPSFFPVGGSQQAYYTNAAQQAGDIYAAKTIAAGQLAVANANAAAAGAAQGIYATARDPNIANSVQYATQHAQSAALSAAAQHGRAAVLTGAAYNSYH